MPCGMQCRASACTGRMSSVQMCALGAGPHGEEVGADAGRCAGKQSIRSAGLKDGMAQNRCQVQHQQTDLTAVSHPLRRACMLESMVKGHCAAADQTQVVDRADSRRWTGLVFATTAVVVAFGSLNSNLHARGLKGFSPVWHMSIKTACERPSAISRW